MAWKNTQKTQKNHKKEKEIMAKKKSSKWRGKSTKPSRGLSKKTKSRIVKQARAGKDIGKKGKKFKEIAQKAAKKYKSKEAGEKVAAAIMWKNIKKKSKKK